MMKQNIGNGCKVILLVCLVHSAVAGVVDNTIYQERNERISSSNDLIATILNNCYDMNCLKGNVLNYLNTFLGADSGAARSAQSVDEQILDRVARILKSNEFKFQLPETFFRRSEVSFNAQRGFDVRVSEEAVVEGKAIACSFRLWNVSQYTFSRFFFLAARKKKDDDDIKKKLLLPVLLLLKLKLKALLPIFTAIIGIKAVKALILSKIAITLVVGFLVYNLIQKKNMMATATEAPTTPSSYDPSSWDPSATSGGPYARVWDPSAQNLAYSAYYNSGSSAGSSASSASSGSGKSAYTTV